MDEASRYINKFYELSDNDLTEHTNLIECKSSDSEDEAVKTVSTPELEALTKIHGRKLAIKYGKIRNNYFEKAKKAHEAKNGQIASFYAEMGHEQTQNIHNINQITSWEIFKMNNPDYLNSNTFDLHGLRVNEAIEFLNDILNEKKIGFEQYENRKNKSFINIIVGIGRHSESGPSLRPNIRIYLKQKRIRFEEPNLGLLKIYLT